VYAFVVRRAYRERLKDRDEVGLGLGWLEWSCGCRDRGSGFGLGRMDLNCMLHQT
jgi:hypothetical protein